MDVSHSNKNYYLSKILDIVSRGWLLVKIEDVGKRYICYGTKINLLNRNNEFERVELLDGPYRDLIAEVPYKESSSRESYLEKISETFDEHPVKIVFDTKKNIISVENTKILSTKISSSNNLYGVYLLEMPSHPHYNIPYSYLSKKEGGSVFSETWLRILSSNDMGSKNFLHFGKHSAGCLVISDGNIWDEMYLNFIRCRKGRYNLGVLIVK